MAVLVAGIFLREDAEVTNVIAGILFFATDADVVSPFSATGVFVTWFLATKPSLAGFVLATCVNSDVAPSFSATGVFVAWCLEMVLFFTGFLGHVLKCWRGTVISHDGNFLCDISRNRSFLRGFFGHVCKCWCGAAISRYGNVLTRISFVRDNFIFFLRQSFYDPRRHGFFYDGPFLTCHGLVFLFHDGMFLDPGRPGFFPPTTYFQGNEQIERNYPLFV